MAANRQFNGDIAHEEPDINGQQNKLHNQQDRRGGDGPGPVPAAKMGKTDKPVRTGHQQYQQHAETNSWIIR